MQIFENLVKLRGFLADDAEVPSSDIVRNDSFAVLHLATASGVWDLRANEWHSRTDWHRIVCPGPFFCGLARGLKRGDYVEVEGEPREQQNTRPARVADESFPVKRGSYAIHAIRITRLDRPDALVEFGEDG